MRKDLVNGVLDYLKSDHWNDFLASLQQDEDNKVWHAHIYAYSSIHPESMNEVLEGYFRKQGRELIRGIDFLTPGPGVGALHNVHPKGLPHFDLFFRYNSDATFEPMDKEQAESGKNVLIWDKAFMDEFYKKFEFQAVGPYEEQQIRDYFKSRHWKTALNLIMNPDVIHLHINLRLGVDPKILELIARDALREQGWTIDYVVPNVFNVQGEYTGKLVLIGTHPETIYDFGWKFDPNVIIEPDYEVWNVEDAPPGFDWCLTSQFNALIAKDNYIKLTDEEIKSIVDQA